ncbi:hypothetical protein [Stenotrophomonas acidaminiphila]|uniref:hypothetical protein n=1 Tax=Stenotrophomonas acidaminiphila TaxID=128780 RepID=UPI001FAEF887|nr:hypothetical protein [Stenotrophomonas acidaminiphila]
MNKTDASLIFTSNVRRLMAAHSDSQASLAARAKVSQRAIGDLMTYGRSHFKNPTLKTIEGVAIAYNLPVWTLMLPNASVELLESGMLPALVEGYAELGAVGRDAMHSTLSREQRYLAGGEVQSKSA